MASVQSFEKTLAVAQDRIDTVLAAKIEEFFGLAEYVWMPDRAPKGNVEPSTCVFEMITFLTTYVDAVLVGLSDETKTRAYQTALRRINQWFMVSYYKCIANSRIYSQAARYLDTTRQR